MVACAARARPPAQPPVGQDAGGQPEVERVVVGPQAPLALRLALEVDAVGVVLLRRHRRELRRAAGGEAEVVRAGGVGDDLRERDLRRGRHEHGARRRAQAGARPGPGRVEVPSRAVECEDVDVGALAVDDLLHAQRVARVQGEALSGARGHEAVAARGRVAGGRRPPAGRGPGAGRVRRSRRLVGDRDGDERAEPVRRVRAREHLVDDDLLLVVQAQDELHQATAGAGRSVPMLSAWTATPTSIPAAATRKTPLGPWAPAIAPPAAAPTAMPTVSPEVCRL